MVVVPTDIPSSRRTRLATVAAMAGLGMGALGLAACQDSADAGDPAAFCAVVATTDRSPVVLDDLDPTDIGASIEAFRTIRASEVMLEANAPEAIKDDLGVLVTYLDDLIEGLETADPGESRPEVYDRLATRSDAVQAASGRIDLYVESTCGDQPS